MELLADSTALPISIYFRGFFCLVVCINFLQGFLAAGNELPSKAKYALSGFCLYSLHLICKFVLGRERVPELLSDVALCQYYLMTLLTFMIALYF